MVSAFNQLWGQVGLFILKSDATRLRAKSGQGVGDEWAMSGQYLSM
jgi:hypothetical protein